MLSPYIFWFIPRKVDTWPYQGPILGVCLKSSRAQILMLFISQETICVVLDITAGRVELKTKCRVFSFNNQTLLSCQHWPIRRHTMGWQPIRGLGQHHAWGQTVIFIIIADLHKRLSMEMLLEECFCSVIMETIFQQGSWLRPAPPPHNQEFLAAAQGLWRMTQLTQIQTG